MKTIATFTLTFVAAALIASAGYANPRDAGSKVRGEANDSFGEAVGPTSRYYYRQTPVVRVPAVTAQPQQAIAQRAAPAQAPANATAAVDNTRSGTRTFSVEPQQTTAAPATTYRTYVPRRGFNRGDNWSAGRKILGYREY